MRSIPTRLWRRFGSQPRGRRIFQTLILVGAVAALVTAWLWQTQPGYWREARAFAEGHSPEQIRALADSVHFELGAMTTINGPGSGVTGTNASTGNDPDATPTASDDPPVDSTEPATPPRKPGFYMTQPSDPRTITLDRDRLRAWVMTHLDAALKGAGQQLPRAIQNPVMDVQHGRFVLGFEYDSPEIKQVISVYFRLGIEEDGRARVLLDGASAGRLPIPVQAVARHLRKNDSHPASEGIATMIDQLDSYRFDPVMPYDGQRNVRILDVQLNDDTADFTVRFEPKK